jgi:hypothetical protein
MKSVYLTYEGSGPGGHVTYGKLVCDYLKADPVIVSACSPRPTFRERRRQKFVPIWGENVKIAIGVNEIVAACKDADIVFLGLATWKATHPGAEDEIAQAIDQIQSFKVLMCLGTNESRLPELRKLYARCSSKIDCWYSNRPLIRDFFVRKELVSKTTPYVVGINPYKMRDGESPVGERTKVITATRFASAKRSTEVIPTLLKFHEDGVPVTASYDPNEASFYFLGGVKNKPDVLAQWNKLKAAGILQGHYTGVKLQEILSSARFSIDHTYMAGDGSLWGDGISQYCQSEAIDWGAVPVVNRKFYFGDGWDSIVHRVDHPLETVELYKNWDPIQHAEMIERGREYVRVNQSFEKFNAAIDNVLSLIP